MKIAVIGASGWLGASVLREAQARGHAVTPLGRAQADVTDPGAVTRAVARHDAVVSAVTDRSTADRSIIPASVRGLIAALPPAGVTRVVVLGGGGSLEVEPSTRFIDLP